MVGPSVMQYVMQLPLSWLSVTIAIFGQTARYFPTLCLCCGTYGTYGMVWYTRQDDSKILGILGELGFLGFLGMPRMLRMLVKIKHRQGAMMDPM